MTSSPLMQISYMQISSLGMLIFIVKVAPLNTKLLNALEIFNEITLMSTSFLLPAFTDYSKMLKINASSEEIR
jgi:hypothetical protein